MKLIIRLQLILLALVIVLSGIMLYDLKVRTTKDSSIGSEKAQVAGSEESTQIKTAIEVKKQVQQEYKDGFSLDTVLEETGKMNMSSSSAWWVNSGAYLYVVDGVAKTVEKELPNGSTWQKKYFDYNASETDSGRHPQNIFRLVQKGLWKDFKQEAFYKIDRYILSMAPERSESNGLLLFNRYLDGKNLYYTGIRVDGTAIIKKKTAGEYFTMAQVPVIKGKYDRNKNPNLLPIGKWIGVRSEVETVADSKVSIKLYCKFEGDKVWKLVAEAVDDGKEFGGKAILEAGHAGIRTDFMDAEFDNYSIKEIIK